MQHFRLNHVGKDFAALKLKMRRQLEELADTEAKLEKVRPWLAWYGKWTTRGFWEHGIGRYTATTRMQKRLVMERKSWLSESQVLIVIEHAVS